MKALVVYYSRFGNTKQVAEVIGEVFRGVGEARTIAVEQLEGSDLQRVDLVVVGTPTHKMNLPAEVRAALDELPKRILRGTRIAAFDTSYRLSAFLARFTAARRLDRALRKLGGKRVTAPTTFYVQKQEGYPLYAGEIDRAQGWAESILKRLGNQGA